MFSSPTKNFEHTIIDKTSWRTLQSCVCSKIIIFQTVSPLLPFQCCSHYDNKATMCSTTSALIRHLGTTPALTHHTTLRGRRREAQLLNIQGVPTILSTIVATTGYCTLSLLINYIDTYCAVLKPFVTVRIFFVKKIHLLWLSF